jgi:glycosyltransferase involved in cell wall biosynthesis
VRMQKSEESPSLSSFVAVPGHIPVSVIIPTRNEARHLARCLEAARCCAEIYVVDSQSTDATVEIAKTFDAKIVQFHYKGGWPKKRQWALDTLPFENEWILLLDADEILTTALADEIGRVVRDPKFQGYRVCLRLKFLGKELRFGDNGFWKLPLFRRGKGHFECRLKEQDHSMADIEVHEHIVVDGPTDKLKNALLHDNVDSLSRYIAKHNEYSNWEARVLAQGGEQNRELKPRLFGTQAQRRRLLKKWFYRIPGSPVFIFLYKYLFRLGFLDGVPGLIYCGFQSVQMFNTKAKIYEKHKARQSG